MNIVIFVSGNRGLEVSKKLLKSKRKYEFLIVTTEDLNLVKKIKKFYNDFIYSCNNVNETKFLKRLKKFNPHLIVVAGFPTIFKKDLLKIPKLGVINLHGGPLPEYRGGSPLNWQIINDEKKIGISIIKMDEGIDTGPVIKSAFFKIYDIDDINSVHKKANFFFNKLILSVIKDIEISGKIQCTKQSEETAIYWSQRKDFEGRILWKQMYAREVFNLVRALKSPYPGAFTFVDNQKIVITNCTIPKVKIKSTPGKFFYLKSVGHYFMCSDKAVLIKGLNNLPRVGICDET